MEQQDTRNLKFRYLLWFYKTVKEEFDRVERKFTQLDIDKDVLAFLEQDMDCSQADDEDKLRGEIQQFKEYIEKKEQDAYSQKFDKEKLKADYYFLRLKLQAVEKTIIKQLGQEAGEKIKQLYETEMQKRILETREHR